MTDGSALLRLGSEDPVVEGTPRPAPSGRLAVAFVPGDPPRTGAFYLYERRPRSGGGGTEPDEALEGAFDGSLDDALEVVLPTASGGGIRRRRVAARRVGVADALGGLGALGSAVAGASVWTLVLEAGLSLIARGRLFPAVSPSGYGTWRAGPLDPADRRLLAELAARFPPDAHPVPLPGTSPLRLASPARLVAAAWDALADTLPRTAAAEFVVGSAGLAFASPDVLSAGGLATWVAEAADGLGEGAGADVALRVELRHAGEPLPEETWALDDGALGDGALDDETEGGGSAARAVLQLTSRSETSLVVDAVDLYAAPAAVLARLGEDAEVDLVQALRRAARAWPPLAPLLKERAPTGLDLGEDLLAELLSEGTVALQAAGIEVRWPAEILADGLELRASIAPAPGVVVEAGLGLQTLVEFRWQATLDGEVLSEEEIEQLAEAKRGLVRLGGRFVVADTALLERLRSQKARRMRAAEALGALLAGTVEVDGAPVPVVAEGPLAEMADRLSRLAGSSPPRLPRPPGLARGVSLRPYQARGVGWLHAMTEAGLGGCLADDMGLGKTLQVIALHLHRVSAGVGPTLVVCPTSLLGNWEREVRRFAPKVPVRRFHGLGRSLAELAPEEVVLTTYGVARQDPAALSAAGFGLVVADEAQHAKNPASATARALRLVEAPTRVALTGTPVENRLSELWSILDWTTPGLLGPLERFVREVATRIEADRDPVATERLARTVRPFVLRRRKTDPGVAPDLPPRMVTDVPVPLTSEQATLYEAEVREALAAIEGEDGIARQALVLRLLTVLKQICNHPAQYLHEAGPLPGRSGKLAALEELVDVIVAGAESVLVFSQFVECLALVEARLGQLGVSCLLLHGKLGPRRRTEIVDAFQAGEVPVLLLSLKAGGVGLNLTRATHVIHYDRWWNPAVEDQATDRAHRIGQDRPVQVHRLVAEGTLEDRIAELIETKRALAEAVVGGGEAWIGRLSNAELADLVRLGSDR